MIYLHQKKHFIQLNFRFAKKKIKGKINKIYQIAVTQKTSKCFWRRTSPFGITITHIAIIINKLNAAEPTIVFGPKSPALKPLPIT